MREVLAHLPEVKKVLIDGTERPIARPQHQGRRDRHYSARRQRTVVATAGGRVVLLTPTAAIGHPAAAVASQAIDYGRPGDA